MRQYLDLLQDILDNGVAKSDRTGTGTRSVFGRQLRFDLRESFPVLTTKKLHLRSIIYELLWFIRGETNIRFLKDNGVGIWTSGPTAKESWVRSMDTSGARGPRQAAIRLTSSRESSSKSNPTPIHGGSS